MLQYQSHKPDVTKKSATQNSFTAPKRPYRYDRIESFHPLSCRPDRPVSPYTLQRSKLISAPEPTGIRASQNPLPFAAGNTRPPVPLALYPILEDPTSVRNRSEILSYAVKHWSEILPALLDHYGFQSYGACQSRIYIRPGNPNMLPPINSDTTRNALCAKRRISKLKALINNTPANRQRRRYETKENIKRYMRHCAARLKLCYSLNTEIQCYYDNDTSTVYVAANQYAKELVDLNDKPVLEIMNFPLYRKMPDFLRRRLLHPMESPISKDARFHIINNSELSFKKRGLHAERQICYFLRQKKESADFYLDPLCLGGIRRPCLICSALCFSDVSQVRPGPVWISPAASTPKDFDELLSIIRVLRNQSNLTYLTNSNGNPRTDCDTESSEGSACEED